MITIKTYESIFRKGTTKEYRKDGVLIGWSDNGEVIRYKVTTIPYELSRAQGYKYWERYFPNRLIWDLPKALQEAIEREPMTYGEYTDRNGEIIGYIG